MSRLSSAVCVAFVLMAPVAALGHHAAAMFETEKTVTVKGIVKEFAYVNPHAWLYVVVTDDSGEETLWGFEAEGPSALMRAGIRNNALQPGDLIFYGTPVHHVALYIGGGEIIHAPHEGSYVQIASMYYWSDLVGAGRV